MTFWRCQKITDGAARPGRRVCALAPAIIAAAILIYAPTPAHALLSNGEPAIDVLGEYNSSTMADNPADYVKNCPNDGASPFGFYYPAGAVIDGTNHWLFVADSWNNRVLVFPLTVGNLISSKTPSYVLGQANFTDCMPNENGSASQSSLSINDDNVAASQVGLAVDPTNHYLYVTDIINNRVMVFPTSSMSNGENASYVIGQTNFTNTNETTARSSLAEPAGVAVDTTHNLLYVADLDNNRVLVFPTSSLSNGENASYVIGQTSFTAGGYNTTRSTLFYPDDVAVDATNQLLYVADQQNNRVMVFPTSSLSNGENASYVIGQTSFTTDSGASSQSGLNGPVSVTLDTTNHRLFVSDFDNNRVMIFPTPITANGENATYVLGATDFTGDNGGDADYNGFFEAGKPAYDSTNNLLYVPDGEDSRVLEFNVSTATYTPSLVAQSGDDACTVTTAGTLYCWGYNDQGEDGFGNNNQLWVPGQTGTATNWTAISMETDDTDQLDACGIAGGALYCWGENGFGEDGLGNTNPYETPQQVGSATNWSTVSQGGFDGCAINSSGALYCWGYNNSGEDGIGNTTEQNSPVQVTYVPGITAGLVGWWKLQDGSGLNAADSSGYGNPGDVNNGPTWIDGPQGGGLTLNGAGQWVTVADAASLRLSGSWTVSEWVNLSSLPSSGGLYALLEKDDTGGCTNYGLYLDNGSISSGMGWVVSFNVAGACTTNYFAKYATTPSTGTWYLVTAVYSSTAQTLTLYVNGASVASQSTTGHAPDAAGGENLGLGANQNGGFYFNGSIDDARVYNTALTGAQVAQLYSTTWSTVSTGSTDTCAINTSGALYCWGYNEYGEDGLGPAAAEVEYTTPQQVGNYNLVFLAAVPSGDEGDLGTSTGVASANTTCQNAATAAGLGGTFKAWVSDGTTPPSSSFTQSTVPYMDVNGNLIATGWTQLTSGTLNHAITLTAAGATESGKDVWTNVSTSGGSTTSGSSTTGNCAAWTNKTSSDKGNYGLSGQTGSTWTASSNVACNTNTAYLYCFQQDGGNTWSSVSQGVFDTCAITTSGKLYCWGLNDYYEIGNNTNTGFSTPVQIGASDGTWTAISILNNNVGDPNTCGVAGGKLYCWGENGYGESGQGNTRTVYKVPTQVGAATTWTAVSMGTEDVCGINNSQLYCWGRNQYGEDGVGSNTDNTTPQLVSVGGLSSGENAQDLLGEYTSMTSTASVLWTNDGPNNGPNALGFYSPAGIALDTANHYLYVSDASGNRILVYALNTDNSLSTASGGHTASYVLGQTSLQGAVFGDPTQSQFNGPTALAYDPANQRLFAVDYGNNRVLVFSTSGGVTNGENASYVIGPSNFTSQGGTCNSSQFTWGTEGLALDVPNQRLFVSNEACEEVLVFNVAPGTISNGEAASYVLGCSMAGECGDNTTQSGFYNVGDLAYDAADTLLYVADVYNNRVLVFNVAPATISNGENASYVLGQSNFTSGGYGSNGTTQSKMYMPNNLSFDANNKRLFVNDENNNRVLVFNVAPGAIGNGENASYVLGQSNFISGSSGTMQSTLNIQAPDYPFPATYGVFYDPGSGRLFVSDGGNNRVLIFDATFGSPNFMQMLPD